MSRRKPIDHERFELVYAANLPLILGYALRRCDQPSDAADIAAEVFLVAWRRLDDLPVGEERLWLFGVARHVLANQRRGRVRRSRLADRLRDELAARPALDPQSDVTADVLRALRQLPARDRELLQLAVWDGLSPSEIATLEQVPAATVRSRLLRARARLRAAMNEPVAATTQRQAADGHVWGAVPSADPNSRS